MAARLGLSKEEIRRLVLGKLNVVYRDWGIEQTPFALAEARVRARRDEISARRDPQEVAQAEDHYRRALALADELGMPPLVAHCHFGLGKLYRRTGDGAKAQEHLTTATTMYREMVGFWLMQAEAELTRDG